MKMRRDVILILVGTLLLPKIAASESAQDKVEANLLFQRGADAIRAGDVKSALVHFESAYAKSPHFAVLYNIGRAHAALGDASAAVQAYERYLAEGKDAIPAERHALVEAEIRRQAALTGQLVVEVSPMQAKVFLDGAEVVGRMGQKMRLKPGIHRLLATHPGHASAEQMLTLAKGEEERVLLTLAPLPVVPIATDVAPHSPQPVAPSPGRMSTSDTPPTRGWQKLLGYTVAGAGVLVVGAGLVVYLNGRSSWQRAIDNGCTKEVCPEPGASYWEDAKHSFTAARILIISGGLVAAGGVVLAFTAPHRQTVALSPLVVARGAGLELAGHW
jgi:hypothetical protein